MFWPASGRCGRYRTPSWLTRLLVDWPPLLVTGRIWSVPPSHFQVPFDQPMQPAGNVEVWLGEVERRMRSSVRHQVGAEAGAGCRPLVFTCVERCLRAQLRV